MKLVVEMSRLELAAYIGAAFKQVENRGQTIDATCGVEFQVASSDILT